MSSYQNIENNNKSIEDEESKYVEYNNSENAINTKKSTKKNIPLVKPKLKTEELQDRIYKLQNRISLLIKVKIADKMKEN